MSETTEPPQTTDESEPAQEPFWLRNQRQQRDLQHFLFPNGDPDDPYRRKP